MRWLILFTWLVTLPAHSEPAKDALDNFLFNLNTLQADFLQVIYDLENNRQEVASGVLKLKRPNQFRWHYQNPEERLILADGKSLWVVENDLEQITQYQQSTALKNTPASIFLSGHALQEAFEINERNNPAGMRWLILEPHDEESDVEQMQLGFNGKQLQVLELTDKFGQITQFHFSAIQRNPNLSDDDFVFSPTEGWDLWSH